VNSPRSRIGGVAQPEVNRMSWRKDSCAAQDISALTNLVRPSDRPLLDRVARAFRPPISLSSTQWCCRDSRCEAAPDAIHVLMTTPILPSLKMSPNARRGPHADHRKPGALDRRNQLETCRSSGLIQHGGSHSCFPIPGADPLRIDVPLMMSRSFHPHCRNRGIRRRT